MFKKVLIASSILLIILFLHVHAVTFAAEWSTMDPGVVRDFYSVWGTSSTNVYAVGTLGINLHYDGNPEGIWQDQGKNSG